LACNLYKNNNMWLLIVITSLFDHSSYDPDIYSFQKFHTQQRCEAIAAFINKKEIARGDGKDMPRQVSAECVFNGKEED
jgi:hypothetical protein